ncbi:MAG: 3-ketoacyl-CoA thiolase with broad chain length specificity [Cyphobasidiales sp. Tagirdzhanova-0007]|nr:MAG: 3-ketoacyl-CoA thiolase with broad chain length specificity [Cyphobasidiales sp. Tagirdzhanova-0007]
MSLQSVKDFGNSLAGKAGKAYIITPMPNDVVICAAVRTPITKAKKGGLKDACPEDLLAAVLKGVLERSGVDPALVEDVAVGNVLPPGGGASVARMAALYVGLPVTTAVNTVNRQCSSGLTTVVQIANEISAGQIDIGIGAGVESMTMGYGAGAMPERMSEDISTFPLAADCLIPMGITSENVAKEFGITRAVQDKFAARSFNLAEAAQKSGKFKEEIVPVKTKWTDPKTDEVKTIVVIEDDGIRAGMSIETLSKIKPAFAKDGTTHAGNASQVSDGAAAVLLARRSTAKKLGLPILGKFVTSAVVGVPPKIMGIGPAYAIPKALEKAGISQDEVDFFEINEAFASQAVYSVEKLKIPLEKVNPVGGAIAFGHPLGATGSRQIATAFSQSKRSGAKIFVTSMCIGSGMGMAAVFVNEQ